MLGAFMYHVTAPEIAEIILRDGFIDHAAQKGIPGFGVTHTFDPGVWFADKPPITAIAIDQFMGRTDEAWISIFITPEDFDRCFKGNEWQDASWPTRQWCIPAVEANKFPRQEVPLRDVLAMRIGDDLTIEDLNGLIESEISDDAIKARWLGALQFSALRRERAAVIDRAIMSAPT